MSPALAYCSKDRASCDTVTNVSLTCSIVLYCIVHTVALGSSNFCTNKDYVPPAVSNLLEATLVYFSFGGKSEGWVRKARGKMSGYMNATINGAED